MTSGDHADRAAGAVPRPEGDDYDLLTFGEVAARLSEELAEEVVALQTARNEPNPDPQRINRIEERIALLRASADRYRREQRTSDTFKRRFGSMTTPSPGPPPRWQ